MADKRNQRNNPTCMRAFAVHLVKSGSYIKKKATALFSRKSNTYQRFRGPSNQENIIYGEELDKTLVALTEFESIGGENSLIDMISPYMLMRVKFLEALNEYFNGNTGDLTATYQHACQIWEKTCKSNKQAADFNRTKVVVDAMFSEWSKMLDLIDTRPLSTDYFVALNDDSVLQFFDRMALDDLCIFSGKSQRLRRLAETHFEQKYPKLVMRPVEIVHNDATGYGFWNPEPYVECFSKQIQSVKIDFFYNGLIEEPFDFLQSNFSENLKEIEFFRLNYGEKSFNERFTQILRNIETVKFNECEVNAHFGVFLNSLPSLRNVAVINSDRLLWKLDWSHIKRPQLTSFTSDVINIKTLDYLSRIFAKHTAITRLAIHFSINCTSSDYVQRALDIAVQCKHIEELFVYFSGAVDFELMMNQLKRLDSRKNFKRMAFDLVPHRISNLNQAAALRSFTELHLSDHYGNGVPDALELNLSELDLMVNLTVLELGVAVKKEFVVNLSKKLQKLEKVALYGTILNQKGIIEPFVFNSPHLLEIEVKHSFIEFGEKLFDLAMLNAERKKLKRPTKVVIIECRHRKEPVQMYNYGKYDLVELRKTAM